MTIIFQYNQEEAMKAGQSGGISTGYHVLLVESAEWRNYNGNESLNFSLVNGQGSKCFIDLRYKGADGKTWGGSVAHIQAIQGLLGGINLTSTHVGDAYLAQELTGRKIGFLIQRRLYNKNDGSEGFSMQLVMACDPQTKQTLKEKVGNQQASVIDKLLETLEDKDDRNQVQGGYQQNHSNYPQGGQQVVGNSIQDDDIPF